jgi:hypothetical protein
LIKILEKRMQIKEIPFHVPEQALRDKGNWLSDNEECPRPEDGKDPIIYEDCE